MTASSTAPSAASGSPRILDGDRTLLRIIVSADDRFAGRSLALAIVECLRERGCAGATAIPGIMGFGARRLIHSELNEITSFGLPIVIEAVDTEARIAAILPELDRMITGGVVTLERARVRLYRPPGPPPHPDAPATEGSDARRD
jgi:hypothetical protein